MNPSYSLIDHILLNAMLMWWEGMPKKIFGEVARWLPRWCTLPFALSRSWASCLQMSSFVFWISNFWGEQSLCRQWIRDAYWYVPIVWIDRNDSSSTFNLQAYYSNRFIRKRQWKINNDIINIFFYANKLPHRFDDEMLQSDELHK